jgi:hypothetical protein
VTSSGTGQFGDEARLWLAALLISILLNGLLLGWVSFEAILSKIDKNKEISKPKPETESIVMLFPEMFVEELEEVNPDDDDPKAVRTSDDQTSPEAPSSPRFMGERDTQVTSDRVATNDDSTMPSQKGREAILEELETTESVYQDGRLDTPLQTTSPNSLVPLPNEPFSPLAPSAGSMKGEKQPDPGEEELSQTAIREKLLDGPNIVEKEVSESEVEENIKPRESKKTQDGDPQGLALKKSSEQPKPTAKPTHSALNDPAFSGNQTKTAIRGNISRTGRSALDVVATPMGRYQAQISRAVELEFQRNCVRRRDFIVPGYITVQFFLDAEGRVTSDLKLIGEIEGGEVQKGFTIDSIRKAEIPAMPPEIKQEMGDHSLELIFNFIF